MADDARTVKISELKRLKEFYPREDIDEKLVNEYVKMLKEGREPPPISITDDNIIADGWHRTEAHERVGRIEIRAVVVKKGDNLLLTGASLNSKQSKPMTDAEKRSVAIKVLADNPDLSIEKIADDLGVSKSSVYEWTKELRESRDFRKKQRALELHAQGKTEKEIEAETGVPRRTVSDWLAENSSSGKIAKSNGMMPRSKYAALLRSQGKTEKQIASALGISPESVAQLLKEAQTELDDQQRAAVAKMVNDDHFPASPAASLVRLGDEKKTEEVMNLWKAREINVREATHMVDDAVAEKAKEMWSKEKPQVEIGLKLGLSQPAVSYLLNKEQQQFDIVDAIWFTLGNGGTIDSSMIMRHELERLVRERALKGLGLGIYALTEEAKKKIADATGRKNRFVMLCLFDILHFDRLGEDEYRAKMAEIDDFRASRISSGLAK